MVQGVGFRPFVAKLADRLGVCGQVKNMGGHVAILATGSKCSLEQFRQDLSAKKPRPAHIVSMIVGQMTLQEFDGFTVEESDCSEDGIAMISPDLAVCSCCLSELKDEQNTRYRHPMISCMECGPRYSILAELPYDRCNTAMTDFPMCSRCSHEYSDRADRRYHAQTISCHDCGPQLIYRACSGVTSQHDSERDQALLDAVAALKHGGIVAVKGIGGYHLACSPFNDATVSALRHFKNREEKPFALMFRDLEQVKSYCLVNDLEEVLLTSAANPIVLLNSKPSDIAESVCRTSKLTGALLPGTPLHYLLVDECGPLIMTSANLSGNPIIKDDSEMMESANGKLSGVLSHHRNIRVSLDDSVVRVIGGQQQMIRRSKGYTPMPLRLSLQDDRLPMLLAFGGQLKASYCLTKGEFAYISQYFGDLDDQRTLGLFEESVQKLQMQLSIKPELCVCDMHPRYFTTDLAEKTGLPVLKVQHHHAHAASVIAEHGLIGSVLGVTFDGTGYGTDETVWGGEFLLCNGLEFTRAGHLEPISVLGGDESMKDAWKSAACHLRAAGLESRIEDARYSLMKEALRLGINTVQSSSMGRLFDAVSAVLGLGDRNRYEAECAILLENAATDACDKGELPFEMSFSVSNQDGVFVSSPRDMFRAMVQGLDEGVSASRLAYGFHDAVVRMIQDVCLRIAQREGIHQIALSGGVFQNALLLSQTIKLLKQSGFSVYTNSEVPSGDGGISLGQAYLGMLQLGMSPSPESAE